MSKNPARPVSIGVVLLAVLLASDCGGSPTKSSPPPDQFPTGPTITCPGAVPPVTSPNGQSVTVVYGTPTATGGAPAVAISCTPPSGATFPVGTNAVVCTATDARQRTASCTFNIVVQQPPRITVTGFVAYGDSITWGEDGSTFGIISGLSNQVRPSIQVPFNQTYPSALQQALRARYSGQTPNVTNAGLPGEKAASADALSRFSSVIANTSYEAVLLMEGTNDIYERDASQIAPAVANLRRMLQLAKSRGMRPFIATIPPMLPGAPRGLAWSLVPLINDQIRDLAASERVPLVDVNAAFGASFQQYLGPDGLHPNVSGYAKIADTFFTSIRATLDTQPTTTGMPLFVPFGFGPVR